MIQCEGLHLTPHKIAPGTVENAVEESVAALSTANILGFFRHVDTEMTGFPMVDDTCSILREC